MKRSLIYVALLTALLVVPAQAGEEALPDLAGTWSYRSFENEADLSREAGEIALGRGTLELAAPRAGLIRGRLRFDSGRTLPVEGSVEFGSPTTLRLSGTTGPRGSVYEFVGYLVPPWPGSSGPGVLVGSVRQGRSVLGRSLLGSWLAVRAPAAAPGREPATASLPAVARSGGGTLQERERLAAADRLREAWEAFFARGILAEREDSRPVTAPMRRDLARESTTPFREPEVVRSEAGVLDATLDVRYAVNQIGDDIVELRSYNGRLVGPTMRAKPGDVLKIELRNNLDPEAQIHDENGHHEWNTTNLHTHGLHVSPDGNSDNVLLKIRPGEVKHLEIKIPADHQPGTFWYHAHKHGSVAAQVASGMSGAIIIEGGLDDVPAIKAARERLFVLQQIPYWTKDRPDGVGVIEPEYQDILFGPGAWNHHPDLQRFTTVNGQVLPVVEMNPGEVQRWRFVASGFRERMLLQLRRDKAGSGTPPPEILPLHEIAVDGIALGKVKRRDQISLWPGYRSDVLVKAPATPGAEYLLIDEATPAAQSLNGDPEERKYVARIRIVGPAVQMTLPTDTDVDGLGLPPLQAADRTGEQSAEYGILRASEGIVFAIDGRPFSASRRRTLYLDDLDEWTVRARNDVGPVAHPFHIHVNPFYVTSIKDRTGRELLPDGEPMWRDTVIIPGDGEVKFLTRYEKFPGTFVQHCHILDHEDLGMMELVEIIERREAVAKREAALLDSAGRSRSLKEFRGRPTIIVFIMGAGCAACMEQVDSFVARKDDFRAANLVCVSSTAATDQAAANARMGPFVQLVDRNLSTFEHFGIADGGETLHGLVILDAMGDVQWRTVGELPFMDLDRVADELRSAGGVRDQDPIERPNIEDLIKEPGQKRLKDYMHAVELLMKSEDAKGNYRYYANLHNVFDEDCQHGCEHWNDLFLPWHRALLFEFEQALQKTDPPRTSKVMIPYWDWSVQASGARYPKEFEKAGSVLCDKRVKMAPPGWFNFHQRRRKSPSGPMFTKQDMKETMDLTSWSAFAGFPKMNACDRRPQPGTFEHEFHDLMHSDFVGGDLANPTRAARDPLFWSFHCYIDLLWDRWQKRHRRPPSSLDSKLRGMRLKTTVREVVDVERLGYSYGHASTDLDSPATLRSPLVEETIPLPSTSGHESVAAWGGSGPFSFRFRIPKRDFALAFLTVNNLIRPDAFSLRSRFYLHPVDVPFSPGDSAFEEAYAFGRTFGLWQRHAGHGAHPATVRNQVTAALREVQARHAGETWVLTWVAEPIDFRDARVSARQVGPREMKRQFRFDSIDLVLDWRGGIDGDR